MLVTLGGITMEVKLVQPKKAEPSMLITLEGIKMDVKPLQPRNAHIPMLVTLEGIFVFLHPAIKVFEDVLIIALQLFRESKTEFPDSTTIEVKPPQSINALPPMLVTLEGIVTEVKPLPMNAQAPMLVTLEGISMEVKLIHPWNA